uniref:Uncharacterized protein n=1 Tax=Eutreptiella gymnastica TaxID=73025 RepID=A0A7S1IWV7_9EUGL|mmetsp:Transcript_48442/g.86250  ORF Transcript_48442/g.86250 Transcript_48442/m.86250 type:complete len:108 (+) Transcript_48442:375-698(+)
MCECGWVEDGQVATRYTESHSPLLAWLPPTPLHEMKFRTQCLLGQGSELSLDLSLAWTECPCPGRTKDTLDPQEPNQTVFLIGIFGGVGQVHDCTSAHLFCSDSQNP